MCVTKRLIIVALAIFGAASANLIDNGICIVITHGDQVMHELKPGQENPFDVYMIPKGKEYDDQRWILESTQDGYFKLKNKFSGRFLGGDSVLVTTEASASTTNQFKFNAADGTDKYDISNRVGGHIQSQGGNDQVKVAESEDSFTVKQCEE
uniref:Erythema protein SVEP-8 n=1 Tax=Simulium vittatum TaxID=7192 RepID=B5M0T2_SIMVI|nr:erythema protein SVEP-8 [Simulium vittatum]